MNYEITVSVASAPRAGPARKGKGAGKGSGGPSAGGKGGKGAGGGKDNSAGRCAPGAESGWYQKCM